MCGLCYTCSFLSMIILLGGMKKKCPESFTVYSDQSSAMGVMGVNISRVVSLNAVVDSCCQAFSLSYLNLKEKRGLLVYFLEKT